MKTITIPGLGSVLHTGPPEEAEREERLLKARAEFVANYCREKGWPQLGEAGFEDLHLEHVLEIRDQPGWQNPLGEEENTDG